MKIGIICTPQQEGEAELFRELLSAKGMAADICKVSPEWEEEMAHWIASDTHFLVILTQKDILAPWFQYLAGFCTGSERTLLIHTAVSLPAHLATVPTVCGDAGLLNFWTAAEKEWRAAEEVRQAVEELTRSGISCNNEEFCRCVAEGEVKAVELFFKAGMRADLRDKRGVPALALAVRGSHRNIIESLIERGAPVDAISVDRGNTALMDAAAEGDLDIVSALIKAGASLDVQSKNGQTALILAVGQGGVEIAASLIRAGADFSVTDSLGMSAYGYAKLFKQEKILNLIEERQTEPTE